MARLNKKRTADAGHEAAATETFSPNDELARLVSCCLLGERNFYVAGAEVDARIRALAAVVPVENVAQIAVHARRDLGLRHTPLLLLVCLAPRNAGVIVREAAKSILRTPRDAMDLVALYWANGKKALPHAFRAAICDGFDRWTSYQIAKYATLKNVSVRLRDLAFLAHPNPGERAPLFSDMANNILRAPDTWESALSVPGVDKRAVWERLLSEHKLGALALIRNLRNMEDVGVSTDLVRNALQSAFATDVWPWQVLAAAREAPAYIHDLDALMIRSAGSVPRLSGHTGILVDVSGSMDNALSSHGTMTRVDAAAGMAVVLREVCERCTIAAFSNQVGILQPPLPRGAALAHRIVESMAHQGTFLGRAVSGFRMAVDDLDRMVILTDEQSHDTVNYTGKTRAFLVNLAPYQRGVSWSGSLTRIDGWSGNVIRYLAAEIAGSALALPVKDDPEED